jgi:hypothetical protein
VQRCLNTVVAVASSCVPTAIHLNVGKPTGSLRFEELPQTSHLRDQCEPLYHQVSLCIASALFLKLEHFTLLNSM